MEKKWSLEWMIADPFNIPGPYWQIFALEGGSITFFLFIKKKNKNKKIKKKKHHPHTHKNKTKQKH